jgi:hypothetical protein
LQAKYQINGRVNVNKSLTIGNRATSVSFDEARTLGVRGDDASKSNDGRKKSNAKKHKREKKVRWHSPLVFYKAQKGYVPPPIFYEPYKVLGADELVIRVLFEDTFYQISIHTASYKSSLMSFQDILPYLQNKITDPLTTMELNMIPDTERETLTCEMYLVYEKVKGNPICETQKLLFHRYKTYSERGYEKEIKKFKTDIQRVETENHEMKLLINGHRDVVSNLESMLHEMHTQRSQLEQRLHQSEQHLKRFKDNILQVVYFNENPNESQRSVASEPTNEVALPTGAFCAEKKCESSV